MRKSKKLPPDLQPEDEVEAALLKRALGFDHEEVHQEAVIDKKSGEVLEALKTRKVLKVIPPDVRALLFWLKNRRPDRWRERVEPAAEEPEYEFDENERNL